MVQFVRLEREAEAVAWEAEGGRVVVRFVWLVMEMVVAAVKSRVLGAALLLLLSVLAGGAGGCELSAASCSARSPGERRSSGVGAKEELVVELVFETTGARRRWDAASSAASEMEIALAFLRVLKANFLGGLKVVRMVWSFSDSALIAWARRVNTSSLLLDNGGSNLAVCPLVVCWYVT